MVDPILTPKVKRAVLSEMRFIEKHLKTWFLPELDMVEARQLANRLRKVRRIVEYGFNNL